MVQFLEESHHRVDGDKILIIGDTHISAIFQGQHIDYQQENKNMMERILEKVEELAPSAIFFLGDLIGVSEKKINDRLYLSMVTNWLRILNKVTSGNVYSVKGNHDFGTFTEFDYFVATKMIKLPTEVDQYVGDELVCRYHFVHYGEESRKLRYEGVSDGITQIVLGHNDYTIPGVTSWYKSDPNKSVNVARMSNFNHVDMIISGHIHQPSPQVYSVVTVEGNEVDLFYPGAVSRVSASETYGECYLPMVFYSEGSGLNYEMLPFSLPPVEGVFREKIAEEEISEEELERQETSKRLTLIVKELMETGVSTFDLMGQLEVIPSTEVVKGYAKEYLQSAIDKV